MPHDWTMFKDWISVTRCHTMRQKQSCRLPWLSYCHRSLIPGLYMILSGTRGTRCISDFQFFRSSPLFRTFKTTSISRRAKRRKHSDEPTDKWNYNSDIFNGNAHGDLRLVDANILENETKPPLGVKMLVRDFIEDSLYNPNYGYFPKQATIFNAKDTTFDFSILRDSAEFQEEVGTKYAAYGADKHDGPGRQLWHTPTELFKVRWLLLNIAQSLMGRTAMVWSCNWTLSCIRIFVEIFSLRRLHYLWDWRGEWDVSDGYLGPSAKGISRSLRPYTIPHYRDQRQTGARTAEKA